MTIKDLPSKYLKNHCGIKALKRPYDVPNFKRALRKFEETEKTQGNISNAVMSVKERSRPQITFIPK